MHERKLGEIDIEYYEINENIAEINYKIKEIKEILRTDYHKKPNSSMAEKQKQEMNIIDTSGKGGWFFNYFGGWKGPAKKTYLIDDNEEIK